MAFRKLSEIASTVSNMTAADFVVAVQNNTTDVRFSGSQVSAFVLTNPTVTGNLTLTTGDILLSSGSAINWASGNMTITHSTGLLGIADSGGGEWEFGTDGAGLPWFAMTSYSGVANYGPWNYYSMARGTVGVPAAIQIGDEITGWSAIGYDGDQFRQSISATISAAVDAAVSNNTVPVAWLFKTGDSTVTAGLERMRIASTGLVSITDPGYSLATYAHTPSRLLIADGSAATPVTAGDTPTLQISRIESIVDGTSGGDGSFGAALSVNLETNNTQQANAFKATVITNPSLAGTTNDNVAVYGGAIQSGNAGSGRQAYGFFSFAQVTTVGNGAVGCGGGVYNSTGVDLSWSHSFPTTVGFDLAAQGGNRAQAGMLLRSDGSGTSGFDVGVGSWPGGIITSFLQDDSSSINVLKATGSHTAGIELSTATFSGNAFASPGFIVLGGTGEVQTPVLKTTTALIIAVDGGLTAAFTANMVGSTGGPTAAAQNGWVKMKDSGGNTVWIPVWK